VAHGESSPHDLVSLLILLVIAGVCGGIGRAIALGFIGALLGSWIGRRMHLPELLTIRVAGERFPVVWSIIGSALFVAVLSLFTRGGRRRREA
jgi:uncharacterized membrane protein YeaQ/YmgE (transglycosylase-associated protein family)